MPENNGIKRTSRRMSTVILIIVAAFVAAYYLMSIPIDPTIPDEIFGLWEGTGSIYASDGDETDGTQVDLIPIMMLIESDRSVSGVIGGAVFENGEIKRNRNNVGRFVGINSDYIIIGGDIKGKISLTDEEETRTVNVPLNHEDGFLKGSINLKQFGKYPDPVLPRIELRQTEDSSISD